MTLHRPRKRFGQHFLHDPLVLDKIVLSIEPDNTDTIVEIGPGEGALTCPLLTRLDKMIAIELDRDLAPALQEKCQPIGELELHNTDALKFDFCQLITGNKKIRIVGNLPYNISTPLLFHLADHARCIQDLHVLVQREVAHRIISPPGNKNYGRLSVMMQLYFFTEALFEVSPGAFRPPPKVQSTFLRLIPHSQPPVEILNQNRFSSIVAAAFSQRRKTLRNCLKGILDSSQIEQAGIDPGVRAETLPLEAFAALSNVE
ncbi:MAG: 16S rRNA (adenine(1518)-N(6)/adenine(1519)-N(6))-dimethyltransferase RsmA [Gammaproteobacteria bacterium]|nr:MAG: 16S rRNA (adenine(1518)-N(6)/adenine(1519)-N(6))-dimethyltransferase RsmA [Gammaproteobacteria bacterium]